MPTFYQLIRYQNRECRRAFDELVTPEVKRLMAIHHGPREHQLRGAYNSRDYSNLFAGDSYQADDATCPVYYWEADPGKRYSDHSGGNATDD